MQMLKIAIILKIAEIFFIVFLCKAILGKKQYQQNIILVCTISFLDKQNNSACLTLQYYLPWNKNSPPWLTKKVFKIADLGDATTTIFIKIGFVVHGPPTYIFPVLESCLVI